MKNLTNITNLRNFVTTTNTFYRPAILAVKNILKKKVKALINFYYP